MNRNLLIIIILVLLSTIISCNKAPYLSDDEKNALFSAPSAIELDKIYNGWKNRDLTPTDYNTIQENEILNGSFKLKMISFKVNGIKEYGALLIPKTDSLIPVRMYIGGFGLNVTTNSVNLILDNSSKSNPFILAIPALRGQSLEVKINGTLYTTPNSAGDHCDAFDGATDDVLAYLNLIQQTETLADVNRTSVRGGSRGCTVALLAGIRDKRIKRVVGVAGPTNMLELTSANENDPTYQCQFLSSYKNNQTGLEATRNRMIASSPLYFADHLPLTQLHMGLQDKIVPISQGYDLQQKIIDTGRSSLFQLFTYDKTHTDIATNNLDLSERIETFLEAL